MKLANKVAIVTGSSSGIGRSIALLFAEEGAKVVVVSNKNIAGGEETAATINANGGEAIFVRTNVSVASEAERLVKATLDKFNKIDILVNNAGIFVEEALIEDIDESTWENVFAVNVKGVFLTTKYVVPVMKKAGAGVIINIASIVGHKPKPDHVPYSSSKGAVIAFTKAMALQLAPNNIRVNCINPALVDTPMAAQFPEELRKMIVSSIPLGRMVKPEEVAHAALYLASDESFIITGAGINIDGGDGV